MKTTGFPLSMKKLLWDVLHMDVMVVIKHHNHETFQLNITNIITCTTIVMVNISCILAVSCALLTSFFFWFLHFSVCLHNT